MPPKKSEKTEEDIAAAFQIHLTRRKALRTRLTALRAELDAALAAENDEDVEIVYEQMEEKFLRVEELNNLITAIDTIAEPDDEMEANELECEAMIRSRRQVRIYMKAKEEAVAVGPVAAQQVPAQQAAVQQVQAAAQHLPVVAAAIPATVRVKLPDLKLRVYKGEIHDWFPWWDEFQAAVDSNPSLPEINKFNYLRTYTADGGAVEQAMRGFHCSADSYQLAVAFLKKRFGRKQAARASHITNLLQLPEVTSCKDTKGLRRLYDETTVHIRSLEALGVMPDTYNIFLKPIMLMKIPEELSVEWHMEDEDMERPMEEFLDFIENRIEGREMSQMMRKGRSEKDRNQQPRQQGSGVSPTVKELSVKTDRLSKKVENRKGGRDTPRKLDCLFCGGEHFPVQCKVPVDRRITQVKEQSRCFQCLGTRHEAKECRNKRPCRSCGSGHHTALCEKGTKEKTTVKEASLLLEPHTQASSSSCGAIYLKTATIYIEGVNGPRKIVCFFDGGAQRTFITKKLAGELGLEVVGQEELSIQAFGAETPSAVELFHRHTLRLRGTFPGADTVVIDALAKKHVCGSAGYERSQFAEQLRKKGYWLADDRFLDNEAAVSAKIDLLIGSENYWRIVEGEIVAAEGDMRAISSKFGLLLHGAISPSGEETIVSSVTTTPNVSEGFSGTTPAITPAAVEEEQFDPCFQEEPDLSKFWTLDQMGIRDPGCDPKESDDLGDFEDHIQRGPDGRYRVPLPWKMGGKERLLPNRRMAERRLQSLLQHLKGKPELLKAYHELIEQYVVEGFISKADVKFQGAHTYLPHRPVVREDKSTTKVRPVMDGSAKTRDGPSLNQCLKAGPNLNPDLLKILIRFRMKSFAWIADIEKAFLQIELLPEDSEAVRFLWLKNPADPSSVVEYKWNRVTFGLTSSPFLLKAVLRKHLMLYVDIFPETVKLILDQLYVDDKLGGADDLQWSIKTIQETRIIFGDACMRMTKWVTNDPDLQKWIEETEPICRLPKSGLPGTISSNAGAKVLGLAWEPVPDQFLFNPSHIIAAAEKIKKNPTKRQVSAISARLFDPLGLLAPVVLVAKVLLQQLWKEKIDWDEQVSDEINQQWRIFIASLKELEKIRIPRWINGNGIAQTELHLFGDASETAFGAVVYIRIINPDGSASTQLVCSKTRVAPLEKVTLPRLELLSCLLAATLGNYVLQALHLFNYRVYCWTDSRVALGWIQGDPERWKQFVRNRVLEICRLTKPEWWRHCPGVENPADLASRGTTASELAKSSLWKNGPSWLQLGDEHWPKATCFPAGASIEETEEEARPKVRIVVPAVAAEAVKEVVIDPKTFSSFNRLCRVTAWVLRFIRHCSNRPKRQELSTRVLIKVKRRRRQRRIMVECLENQEISGAQLFWIRQVQEEAFPELFKHYSTGQRISPSALAGLSDLRPRWDIKDRVIKVTGRIELALADQEKEPLILLPKSNWIVDLIIAQTHRRLLHAGTRTILAELKERFWIICGRQQVNRILGACVPCKKQTSRHFDELPAPLPLDRIREATPFEVSGVDFAGPLYVRHPSNKKKKEKDQRAATSVPVLPELKVYICLFTCAVTRGIHLELVPDLTARSFVLAIRRFFGRRGISSVIYSDNAKTFKQASRYLRALRRSSTVYDYLTDNHVDWRFSASLSPWWGGFWERMVRTTKEHLRKSLGRTTLDYHQMETVLIEIESVINSRPLCYFGEGVQEPLPLTPSHLIYGRRSTSIPTKPAPVITANSAGHAALLKREYEQRQVLNRWWKSWNTDYLLDLNRFRANGKSSRTPRVGEVVLIHDANAKRALWKTGIVEELIIGKNGLSRAVWLRTSGVERINRSIQCLYPIEVQADDDCDQLSESENSSVAAEVPEQVPVPDATTDDRQKEEESPEGDSPGECVENTVIPPEPIRRSSRGRRITTPLRYRK